MPAVATNAKILVTSGSGYIGAWTCLEALKQGLSVRTTVRTADKGEHLKRLFSKYGDRFEYAIAEDLEKPGVFDQAVQGVHGVAHTGSPFHFNTESDPVGKLINPAVNGTKNVLKSVLAHGKDVQRVVITSSYAAVIDSSKPDRMYLNVDEDWNEYDPKEVEKQGKDVPGIVAYRASKVLAEKAAWKFVETHKPTWDLSTVQPPLVLGPLIHEVSTSEQLNTSAAYVYALIHGNKDADTLANPGGNCVDVRDVADVHIKALLVDQAGGQRLPACFGPYTWQDWADAIHASRSVPDDIKKQTPIGQPGNGKDVKQKVFDRTKSEKMLGITFKDIQRQADDMIKSFVDYENRSWKGLPADEILQL
ncbi:putative D-lactaldehyde dehydrogenase [Tilletiaria anomala UBC 951]|uniref:Putative D-lactaldehyde dehydrogenase n=1 Tax=Tilletiaria anomala (strain ATCC 24038 / CBS 436.72 / UBC 951) TaxID=1037660 RepID=A0A066V4I5_TILAU|nr:putative D-lactaldehyde dehydrogenase [Tilletiaria anomala UBC 951]KDN36642.1 putative D-lactaldehyde dehydrogenase [Tilletiaria anomala UBC 951]